MQQVAVTYLVNRLAYRVGSFFVHWYLGSLRAISRTTLNTLESLDRSLAWRVTLTHLFEPLYQDHSIIGHTLGFSFRIFRLMAGSVVYGVVIAVAVLCYLAWIGVPTYFLLRLALGGGIGIGSYP